MKLADALVHAILPIPTVAFLAFGVAREAQQQGGLAEMGVHSWLEALAWGAAPFALTLTLTIAWDFVRARKRKSDPGPTGDT